VAVLGRNEDSRRIKSTVTLKADASADGTTPEDRGGDAFREAAGIDPKALAVRIFGADATGSPGLQRREPSSRSDREKAERQAIISTGVLPLLESLGTVEAQGTEHKVRFRGALVEKHQRMNGWVPVVTQDRKIGITHAIPSEYLRRLELQNDLFGDKIRIIGITKAHRFATTQPTLKGGEPTELEIRQILEDAGWERVPIGLQELPTILMGSTWWHREEKVILLDARKPNFKKTDFGILPIDLVLADLTPEMGTLLGLANSPTDK